MQNGGRTRTAFTRINPRDLTDGDLDELLVGTIDEDGLSEGFAVIWSMLGGERVARVAAFADAWTGMLQCMHLLRILPVPPRNAGVSGHPTVEEVIAALEAAGCTDASRPPRFPRAGDPA